jgi:myo-inositol 2-dehydrogenase / D-chiro-inositol 1-dehydrogenase
LPRLGSAAPGKTVDVAFTDLVRVGMVGAGGVAHRHARVLAQVPQAVVVGVADPDRARAVALANAHGVRSFGDTRTMVDAVEVDALYVCVPPYAHGEPEMVAVEHRLALFVEKPLSADLATAERLGAAIAAADLVTATGYHWRCLDTVRRARELLAGRGPALVAARWIDKVPPPAWWPVRRGSGGQVVEQATHLIDLVRHLAGEVVAVTAHGVSRGHCGREADIDEATVATLTMADGTVGTLTLSCLAPHAFASGLEIVAPGLALELTEERLIIHDREGVHRIAPVVDPRRAVDGGFVDLVRGRPFPAAVSYAEALRTHRVACAIAASALDHSPVAVGQP